MFGASALESPVRQRLYFFGDASETGVSPLESHLNVVSAINEKHDGLDIAFSSQFAQEYLGESRGSSRNWRDTKQFTSVMVLMLVKRTLVRQPDVFDFW